MEEKSEIQEFKVRMKVNQLANNQLRFETTVRADTVEEADKMLKDSIEKCKARCDEHNQALMGG